MIGIDLGGSNLRAAVIGGATHLAPWRRTDITLSDVDTAAAAGEDWALGLWGETATLLAVTAYLAAR
jgi:predicted NBD/HSP70 family sugar kinase